jgi:hypothetical protein
VKWICKVCLVYANYLFPFTLSVVLSHLSSFQTYLNRLPILTPKESEAKKQKQNLNEKRRLVPFDLPPEAANGERSTNHSSSCDDHAHKHCGQASYTCFGLYKWLSVAWSDQAQIVFEM